jgi:ribosome-associated protein
VIFNKQKIIAELKFKAIRSSGAGGQHVNKTSSKIELTFDLENSTAFSESQKNILREKLASKLTKNNLFILFCEETRSQHKNKEIVIKRLLNILEIALKLQKKRKPTRPSKSSLLKKAENKQRNSLKKELRKKPKLD